MGLLALAAVGCVLLYALAMNQLDRSVEASVTEDLTSLQSNTAVYVRQSLMLEERNNDEESFRSAAKSIAEELYATNRRPLTLYSLSGERLLRLGDAGTAGGPPARPAASSRTPPSRARWRAAPPTACTTARTAPSRRTSSCP